MPVSTSNIKQRELSKFVRLAVWILEVQFLISDFDELVRSIISIWRKGGPAFATSYLKNVRALVVAYIGGQPLTVSKPWVSCTKGGLPRILPRTLRFWIMEYKNAPLSGSHGLRVTKAILTLLGITKVIRCPPILKLESITGEYTGKPVYSVVKPLELERVVAMLPKLTIPSGSFLAVSESAGPNFSKATWSAGLDLVGFLLDKRSYFNFLAVTFRQGNLPLALIFIESSLCIIMQSSVSEIVKVFGRKPMIGRLHKINEGAGKVRVIAITDWWTQQALRPLHDGIFSLLKTLTMDGTFDQHAPLKLLKPNGHRYHSFDLTAATDRLPVSFQISLLREMGVKWALNWAHLLTHRSWYLATEPIKYAVGQPMGAYSSWAMLALSHHVIVQVAALRAYDRKDIFQSYALLGDDIVIHDDKVAEEYLILMKDFGVEINLSKSLRSHNCFEFAKKLILVDQITGQFSDWSPLGAGLTLQVLRDVRYFGALIRQLMSHGISPTNLKELVTGLSMFRRKSEVLIDQITLSLFSPLGGLFKLDQYSHAKAWETWVSNLDPRLTPQSGSIIIRRFIRQELMNKLSVANRLADTEFASLMKGQRTPQLFKVEKEKGLFLTSLLIYGTPAFLSYLDLLEGRGDKMYDENQGFIQSLPALRNVTPSIEDFNPAALYLSIIEEMAIEIQYLDLMDKESYLTFFTSGARLQSFIKKYLDRPIRRNRSLELFESFQAQIHSG